MFCDATPSVGGGGGGSSFRMPIILTSDGHIWYLCVSLQVLI